MSFVETPRFFLPLMPDSIGAMASVTGNTNADLNGAAHYAAMCFIVPKTATVDRVFFRTFGATTGCTALIRLETMDTATGLPSGTLVHANASQTQVIGAGGADYAVSFPGTFTVTCGDFVALYIGVSSGTPSGVSFMQFSDDGAATSIPYFIDFTVAAVSRDTLALCFGIGITGGSALQIPKMWPITNISNTSFQATSTPDTIGNRVTISAPLRVSGLWVWVDLDSTGTFRLYDSDGVTSLASVALHTNVPPTTSPTGMAYFFATPVELTPGDYFIAVEATGGANIQLQGIQFPSADWRAGSPHGGADFVYASCTQPPTALADWTITTTQQAFVGLICDGVSDGAGGGGGGAPVAFST